MVPQTNTLDRSLTVWENLYFHGRFFGMNAKHGPGRGRPSCSSSSASPSGPRRRCWRCRAAWRSGSWWPGRSCTGPSILFLDEPTAGLDPQSRIALWEILGELHVDGQTILLTTHYMEEADQLCDRLAIIDHGTVLALDTPAELKRSIGADTDRHGRRPTGDLDALAERARSRDRRRHRAPTSSTAPSLLERARAPTGVLPAVVQRRRAARLRRHRPLGHRAHARDRLHQPHREGPPRMTATADPHRSPPRSRSPRTPASAPRRVPGAAAPRPHRAAQEPQGVHPPHVLQPLLLVFVFTYVFPKIGQGVGGSGRGGRTFSTLLVAGVVGLGDHVPGHPGRRPADGAGVRLHAGDRGPRPRAAAGRAGRGREDRRRRAAVPVRRAARVPDRRDRAGDAGAPRTSTGRCCSRSRRSPASWRRRSG